jgi:hypothetical protein
MTNVEDYRAKAVEELKKMREDCQKWGVPLEVKNLREYVAKAGISLSDIGTSEEEIQDCFKVGHLNAAKTWLRMAREHCQTQDVSTEIGHIRSLIAEAKSTLADVGTSEEELRNLLAAYKPARSWFRKLFRRSATWKGLASYSVHPRESINLRS